MKSVLNAMLILAAIAGMVMLAAEWQTLSELQRECDRLSDRYGHLEIRDPNKFSVLRLESSDPWDFTWRLYQPLVPDMRYRVTSGTGSTQSGTNSSGSGLQPRESIIRFRFVREDNQILLHRITDTGSGRMSIGGSELTPFLSEHWEELEFIGIEDGQYATNDPLRILTIRIPDSLLKVLSDQHPRYKRLADRSLVEIVIGTGLAFESIDAKKEEP